jgi:hypothetical protein
MKIRRLNSNDLLGVELRCAATYHDWTLHRAKPEYGAGGATYNRNIDVIVSTPLHPTLLT